MTTTPKPLIIDCDTGRDDALAIWVALALDIPVAGIVASYGNVPLADVIENNARILHLAGRPDIPLLAGAAAPAIHHQGYQTVVLPRQTVAGNGLCNLDFPKGSNPRPQPASPAELAERLAALAQHHGKLDYVILGPATNFAALCDVLGDRLSGIIGSVTMMGGRLGALWDETPQADFNIVCDPYAVRSILQHGINLRFVTLNTTWPIALSLNAVETLQGDHPIAVAARDLMVAHARHFAPEPIFRFHDPAVIAAIIDACAHPDHFRDTALQIHCDDRAADFGRLIESETGFPAQIYSADPAVQAMLLKTILGALQLSRPAQ